MIHSSSSSSKFRKSDEPYDNVVIELILINLGMSLAPKLQLKLKDHLSKEQNKFIY